MPIQLISEEVNLFDVPVPDKIVGDQRDAQVAIGDLHGNGLKMLFTLIKEGVITGCSQDDYDEIAHIYCTDPSDLKQGDLEEFMDYLNEFQWNNLLKLTFLGDDLADRGFNDIFTIMIYLKLFKAGINFEVIISNHNMEFIEACERLKRFEPTHLDENLFAKSMANLQLLIDKGFVSRELILNWYDRIYLPSLKAVSYSLNHDNTEMTLYTHAPVGQSDIEALAKQLDVKFDDTSIHAFTRSIDEVNQAVKKELLQRTLHMLLEPETDTPEKDSPFTFMLWNRELSHLKRPNFCNECDLNFVHGHDKKQHPDNHIYNLDTTLGMSASCFEDTYVVLRHQKYPKKECDQESIIKPDSTQSMTKIIKPIPIRPQDFISPDEKRSKKNKRGDDEEDEPPKSTFGV